ncbi:MAG: DNA-binding protein [Caulobacteraceae bacterium]|nr:DNA-binding protein [Caulobacteraceae bacterium]
MLGGTFFGAVSYGRSMVKLSHTEIWRAIDALAARQGLTPSALARRAGLDPTSFNRSKRISQDTDARPRWPSTESLAKVLSATGMGFSEFAALAEGRSADSAAPHIPLIGQAPAGGPDAFHSDGRPTGHGWEEMPLPDPRADPLFALQIDGDSMTPAFRDGDRVIVCRTTPPAPGDRVVVRTKAGEVLAKQLAAITDRSVELASLNPAYENRLIDRQDVAWMGRILWVSQ